MSGDPTNPRGSNLQGRCKDCREWKWLDLDLLCDRCAADRARGYRVRLLTGRRCTGYYLGTRLHALPIIPLFGGVDSNVALCGARPGPRSAGWSEWGTNKEVTCPRCLRKLAARKPETQKE